LQRGKPHSIRVDYGPEFSGRLLDQWAYLNKAKPDFPREPKDNSFIEASYSRLHQEWLNASWFLWIADACHQITDWRADYDKKRSHSALGNLTPSAFAAQLKPARKVA
jgi:putative transposase